MIETILVVDDQPRLLELVAREVRDMSKLVVFEDDGEIPDRLKKYRPDAAIIDMGLMYFVGCMEVLRRFCPNKIVILTGQYSWEMDKLAKEWNSPVLFRNNDDTLDKAMQYLGIPIS